MQKNSHEKQKYTLHCAVWEFTLGCNFRCIHCGASAGIPRNDELNPAEALKFVDDLADIGCRGVGLIGGEPFVRPDWFDVSKRINERGMILSYVSNGWLMSDELAEKISSLAPRSFGLSIDGTEMIHDQIRKKGSYQRCIRAMKILEKHCIHTSIITTVHRMNLSCLPSVFNLLSGKNVCWQIQIATPHGTRFSKDNFLSADEHYQVVKFVYEARKKAENSPLKIAGAHDIGYFSECYNDLAPYPWFGCEAGRSVLGIQSNGNVKACLSLPDEFIIGNIRKTPIAKIWNSAANFPFTRKFSIKELGGACAKCKHAEQCRGGCSDVAYSATGKIGNNPYCAYALENRTREKV